MSFENHSITASTASTAWKYSAESINKWQNDHNVSFLFSGTLKCYQITSCFSMAVEMPFPAIFRSIK